jgi:hypothetical protein
MFSFSLNFVRYTNFGLVRDDLFLGVPRVYAVTSSSLVTRLPSPLFHPPTHPPPFFQAGSTDARMDVILMLLDDRREKVWFPTAHLNTQSTSQIRLSSFPLRLPINFSVTWACFVDSFRKTYFRALAMLQ